MHGPYTIKIDGQTIENVQSYEIYRRASINVLRLDILTDNLQIKRANSIPIDADPNLVSYTSKVRS